MSLPYHHECWHPSADINQLRLRAKVLADVRQFFADRQVLEVETPLLSHSTTTATHLASFTTSYYYTATNIQTLYLQTSPEYAMKRLLCAGSGSIYQICKAFRQDEQGRRHNPEFTLLEWYRTGFNHHQLMDEVADLLTTILQTPKAERFSYQQIFQNYLNLDPISANTAELRQCAKQQQLMINTSDLTHDDWLNLLLTHCIEPHLGKSKPTFIYDYPASQSALAKISQSNSAVAERFEVYVQGIELANGYHELTDADEQLRRFQNDNRQRQQLGLPQIPIDDYLLAALKHGMPNCSGVALGIDRLVMLAANVNDIAEIISFNLERA